VYKWPKREGNEFCVEISAAEMEAADAAEGAT
jgi:hypothetical protein